MWKRFWETTSASIILRMAGVLVSLAFLLLEVEKGKAGSPDMGLLVLDTEVAGLPAGTKVEVELRAQYALVDFASARAGGRSEPEHHFVMKAPEVFRWTFTADGSGSTARKVQTFQFSGKLKPPPGPGMMAVLQFPLRYKITCPPNASGCRSRERVTQFASQLRSESATRVERCLAFHDSVGDGITVGIGRSCDSLSRQGLKKRPRN